MLHGPLLKSYNCVKVLDSLRYFLFFVCLSYFNVLDYETNLNIRPKITKVNTKMQFFTQGHLGVDVFFSFLLIINIFVFTCVIFVTAVFLLRFWTDNE